MLDQKLPTWDDNPGNVSRYAHDYLDRGFAPVPVEFRSKACKLIGWPNIRLDHEGIEREFQAPCNIGIILGEASGGLVDIDLDCPEAIALAAAILPPTGMIFGRDSKRASHWIYKAPGAGKGISLSDPEGNGMLVELRANSRITVFPGSVHESGEEIRFDQNDEPAGVQFDELGSYARQLAAASLLLRHWKKGHRHNLALALSGTLLSAGITEENAWRLMGAMITAANDAEHEDRRQCLSSTARKLKAGEPIAGRTELERIIGEKSASSVCESLQLLFARKALAVSHAGAATALYGGPAPYSDMAHAERFAARNRPTTRYCHKLGAWLIWNGIRWETDDTAAIERIATQTMQDVINEAVDQGDIRLSESAVKALNAQRLRSVLSLAEGLCSVHQSDFDADPWKLNCKSGVIDLKTGELCPHHPEALMRKLAPVDFDAHAKCPRFHDFLDRIFEGGEELIGFLQRAIGYSLTGDKSEQCLFVLNGSGANGKSTLIRVIQDLLGDYAQQTPMETLMVTKSNSIPNDVARLEGARFVAATESEAGQRLAEAKIKQLTGGDRVAARFLYGEHFEYTPQFKLWLATNKLPEIRGTDEGIWRRFRVVPFNVTIPEPEQDRNLSDRLRTELPGILNWAVAGCLDWQRERLRPPGTVTGATRVYRAEMDVVAQYTDDCCVVEPQAEETLKGLYDGYVEWCQANGETALAQRAFRQRLSERGFKQGRTRKARKWLGIRTKTEAELLQIQESGFPELADGNPANENQECELADIAAEY